jgi:hypothetical protein
MPGLAVREFECSLCHTPFTMLSGDLILPGPNICDDCLREIWELEGKVLVKHVAGCLGSQSEEKGLVHSVIQHIKWHRGQWRTAEDVIRDRERERGVLE